MPLSTNEEIIRAYDKKYQDRTSVLIPDGIVDPEQYGGILFLLKEAYSREKGRGTWYLCDGLAQYGPWGMWHHVAKWTHGLLHTTRERIEPYARWMDHDQANGLLRKIAAVNVKKIDGRSSSKAEDLERFVSENAELLRRQIELAKPRVIVCGNTFRYLQTIFGTKPERHCENWYYWMDLGELKDVLVLDYYHPAVRYPELMTYYGLMGCYQQALRSRTE